MSGPFRSTGLLFTLTTANLPQDAFVVIGFELHEAFSSLFILNIQLASTDPAVDFGTVLDDDATLSVWQDGVLQRCVMGMVTDFEQGDTGFHSTRYSMVIRPHLWRTSLRRNSRIFQYQDLQNIIDILMKENGNIEYDYAFRYPHPEREFCVQYQEDDLSFLHRLAAEEGVFYYFEFDGNTHTVVFTDDVSAQSNGVTLPYNPSKNAQAKESCITSFRCSERVRTARVSLKDYTFKNPLWPAEFMSESKTLAHQRASYEHYDYPGRFKDEKPGKDYTRYRIEALRNDAHQGRGESNSFRLQPGERFTLINHPRPDLNTRWQIVNISHIGSQPQALEEESGGQGTTLTNVFNFMPIKQTWRPTPLPKPKIDGPQIALVVGPPGEEIYTDKYGRVRLRFLWDRYSKGDDTSSCWIRVSQAWAGQGWGFMAVPRIGHEVIVDFLDGDPDQPIVTGRTYHANNLNPTKLPGSKTQTVFRSKTHKGRGFNELRFEDQADKQEVFIHAQKDMNTKVLDNRTTNVGTNHTEMIGADQSITVNKNQTNTVKQHKVEAVAFTATELVGLAKTSTIGAAYALTVGAGMNTAVALSQTEQVGINKSLSVGNNLSMGIGNMFTLDAENSLIITVGSSKLTMKKDGSIILKGVKILVDADQDIKQVSNRININ